MNERKLPLTEAEKTVLTKSMEVNIFKPNLEWLTDQEFRDFLNAWFHLIDSYSSGESTVICLEIVGNYQDWTKRLFRISTEIIDPVKREQVEAALNKLEGSLFEIQREASRTLNNL